MVCVLEPAFFAAPYYLAKLFPGYVRSSGSTAGAYLLLVAIVYVMQAGMLYLPNLPGRDLDATPDAIGMPFEDVTLEASDGVSVHGWFVPGESERVLLYFHGNAGNISHRLYSVREWRELGLSVFIIDYRGYGQSGGKPAEKGLYETVRRHGDT